MVYKEKYFEGLVDMLLATLGSSRSTRHLHSILFERKLNRYKKESIKVALSRLRSKGYIDNSALGWSITKDGKRYIKNKNILTYTPSPFTENLPANTIISFDIPEKNRIMRNWLRNQIKIFGYKMLQQSLWLGPGPLPSNFLKRLEDLDIRKNIKTFRITKGNN